MLAGLVLSLIVQALLVQGTAHCCPAGWKLYNGKCYGFGTDEVSWADALTICKAYGGTLAEPRDPSVHDWLVTQLTNSTVTFKDVWIGGTDIFQEGVWRWVSDKSIIRSGNKWYSQQPNDNDGEDCMELYRGFDYDWNDESCHNDYYFICQVNQI